jgi:hypothetical protein
MSCKFNAVCMYLLFPFISSEFKIYQFRAVITDQMNVRLHYVGYIATLFLYKCFVFEINSRQI